MGQEAADRKRWEVCTAVWRHGYRSMTAPGTNSATTDKSSYHSHLATDTKDPCAGRAIHKSVFRARRIRSWVRPQARAVRISFQSVSSVDPNHPGNRPTVASYSYL